MTVPVHAVKKSITCDGETRVWQFDYPLLAGESIAVWVKPPQGSAYQVTDHVEIDTQRDQRYTFVTYPSVSSGLSPLAAGYQITLLRTTPLTQNVTFGTHVIPQTLTDAFDKTVLQLQNLDEKISRCVQYVPDPSLAGSATDATSFLDNVLTQARQTIQTAAADVEALVPAHNSSDTSHADIRQAITQAQSTLSTALSSEQTSRQQADTSLQESITGLTAALGDEATARAGADTSLQTQLTSQTQTIGALETALTSGLATKQDALSAAQIAAVNSGVTSQTVAQVSSQQESITAIQDTLEEAKPWAPHADWVDIRAGALPNSVYFLVAHSADYSTYPTFVVQATISNSGTYDVFVDGIKQATTASGTETTLTWQTLALTSEWEVTYPASLKTHIVRVTPSTGTNTITNIRTGAISNKGILWAHFTTQNYISLEHFAQSSTSPNASDQAPVWESVTSLQDKLNISNLAYAFDGIRSVKTVPALVAQSNSTNTYATLFLTRTAVKKVKLVNIKTTGASMFRYCFNLEEAEFENCVIGGGSYQYIFQEANNLKKIPSINFKGATDLTTSFTKMPKLEPTFLDFSSNTVLKKLDCYGTSTVPSYGIKGITVSNEAPFDGGSPQLFVAYTGMDRTALVNLFNSMPYNVGYTVVGSPTIVDGVVSEFSDSNHLNLTDTFDPKKPYKIQVKFKLNSAFTNVSNDFFGVSTSGIFHLRITPSGKLDFCVGNGIYDFNVVEIEGTTILSANTDYWVQFEFTGTKYIIRLSTDGTTWTEENSLNSTAVPNPGNPFTLQIGDGHSNHWYFRGSIDLNETYININGIPWFTGKAAMTKTCNVVGCTGTADLTAEDKAIATDKGWALTLS